MAPVVEAVLPVARRLPRRVCRHQAVEVATILVYAALDRPVPSHKSPIAEVPHSW
jgi:hypothetical protein